MKENVKDFRDKKARKYFSVMCSCGHRNYISSQKKSMICHCCGRKHYSPKEQFKNTLVNLMGQVDRKA